MTRNKVYFSLFMSDAIAYECIAIIIPCGLLDNRSLQPHLGTVTHFLVDENRRPLSHGGVSRALIGYRPVVSRYHRNRCFFRRGQGVNHVIHNFPSVELGLKLGRIMIAQRGVGESPKWPADPPIRICRTTALMYKYAAALALKQLPSRRIRREGTTAWPPSKAGLLTSKQRTIVPLKSFLKSRQCIR